MDDLYKVKEFDTNDDNHLGKISERDKFLAAKQILLGLAILYVLTIAAYMIKPDAGMKLLDIITIVFPPLATLILAAYFRSHRH